MLSPSHERKEKIMSHKVVRSLLTNLLAALFLSERSV